MRHFLPNHCMAALALILLLTFTAQVPADDVQGTIATANPDEHVLTLVDNHNDIVTIRMHRTAQVLINDEERTVWDLLPADRVVVIFELHEDEMWATDIFATRTN